MNYRHIFHAGNVCDVVKHATLTLLIAHLRDKLKPFCVIDTHAGTGLYDRQDPRAQKTNEAHNGIRQFLQADFLPELADYYAVLQKINPTWNGADAVEKFRFYPGSPLLAAHLMRATDRLVACEWHEADARELRLHLRNFPQAHIHHRDGYEALKAFLPPPEKRGLVLIDPPYENTDEFRRLTDALVEGCRRWSPGVFMAWYPIKERPAIWQFHEKLTTSGLPNILCAEFIFEEETRADRLNGSGLIIINPPWQLDEKLRGLFPALHQALHTTHQGGVIKWLTGER